MGSICLGKIHNVSMVWDNLRVWDKLGVRSLGNIRVCFGLGLVWFGLVWVWFGFGLVWVSDFVRLLGLHNSKTLGFELGK